MNYKAVVLDLDGTLTNSEKKISERNRLALMDLQRRGVRVVLASGRPVFGIEHLSKQLQLSYFGGYILAYNGGIILDCKSGRQVFAQTLPEGVAAQLAASAKKHGLGINTYDDSRGCILTETPENEWIRHEGALNNNMPVVRVADFGADTPMHLPKCLMVADGDYLAAKEPLVRQEFAQLAVYRSSPFFLEIVPQGIDKAASLSRLSALTGIRPAEMVAMGDGYNDLSMIEFAGLGIAMGNACDQVKQAADFVSLDNDHDGVAHAIEKYFN